MIAFRHSIKYRSKLSYSGDDVTVCHVSRLMVKSPLDHLVINTLRRCMVGEGAPQIMERELKSCGPNDPLCWAALARDAAKVLVSALMFKSGDKLTKFPKLTGKNAKTTFKKYYGLKNKLKVGDLIVDI